MEAKTSKSRLKANDKYIKSLDEFKVRVQKGKKDQYKEYAESKGLSLNALVINLIEKDMGEQ